ncbi:ABC transporter related [Alicyclobacillus acidocaldarius subsp. acidocaldarius DSM 446]|uniref:ABC transporter related n=1 Tax=Alicyclobacillus acidocaldarius subsp. acidocaldarius (strain ATCC 27009 / DSM 446 / BCRC 14685 / JCM 5260 / KCTC 1825 / NBRC 15652 / NCIMB 11725 / NRRL B-14509 / 104-IA) TaxID=521098 RepID=C8WRN1_ALIAD|nr:ABC transporter related [Alicyclobacillus acidocaldarius subsp. acidocaldarius DSM 446]
MAGVYRRLSRFYRPYLSLLWVSLGFLVLTALLQLAYPYLLKAIVNRVILGHREDLLLPLSAAILLASLVKGVCNFTQAYLAQVFGARTAFDLRNELYRKLNHLPFRFYDEIHTGDLMSRLTADLDAFRMFFAFGINNLMNLFLTIVFSIGMMLTLDVRLALLLSIVIPVLAATAIRFDKKIGPVFMTIRQTLGRLNSGVQESLMGVRTVKSFAREAHEIDKFRERNQAYYDANIRATRLWRAFFPAIELTGNLGVVLILLVGGWLVMSGHMNLGDLVAFLSLIWYMIWPMSQLGFFLNNWTQATAAGARLLEILEQEDDLDASREEVDRPMEGLVEFRGVSVKLGGEYVLRDITFTARPGQTLAIVGLTGSGKSTLVSLIPRFRDVDEGAVLVDGVDVRQWKRESLRRQVGFVFQEAFLFSTTIFANIAYGRPGADMARVQEASEVADAAEFIHRLPDGYLTLVGERGLGLSGGQRQRVSIARALVPEPRILILDDATSAVDMETEEVIQKRLAARTGRATTFLIAQRLNAVKDADEILVLDGGRIVERGRHQELLDLGGLYRQIYDMQFRDLEALRQFANPCMAEGER